MFLALNDTNWTKYLPIEAVKNRRRSLRIENTIKVTRGEANCFSNQDLVFNELPKSARCSHVSDINMKQKKYYMDKALARSYLCK